MGASRSNTPSNTDAMAKALILKHWREDPKLVSVQLRLLREEGRFASYQTIFAIVYCEFRGLGGDEIPRIRKEYSQLDRKTLQDRLDEVALDWVDQRERAQSEQTPSLIDNLRLTLESESVSENDLANSGPNVQLNENRSPQLIPASDGQIPENQRGDANSPVKEADPHNHRMVRGPDGRYSCPDCPAMTDSAVHGTSDPVHATITRSISAPSSSKANSGRPRSGTTPGSSKSEGSQEPFQQIHTRVKMTLSQDKSKGKSAANRSTEATPPSGSSKKNTPSLQKSKSLSSGISSAIPKEALPTRKELRQALLKDSMLDLGRDMDPEETFAKLQNFMKQQGLIQAPELSAEDAEDESPIHYTGDSDTRDSFSTIAAPESTASSETQALSTEQPRIGSQPVQQKATANESHEQAQANTFSHFYEDFMKLAFDTCGAIGSISQGNKRKSDKTTRGITVRDFAVKPEGTTSSTSSTSSDTFGQDEDTPAPLRYTRKSLPRTDEQARKKSVECTPEGEGGFQPSQGLGREPKREHEHEQATNEEGILDPVSPLLIVEAEQPTTDDDGAMFSVSPIEGISSSSSSSSSPFVPAAAPTEPEPAPPVAQPAEYLKQARNQFLVGLRHRLV
ncbi:MAG: hypothetical protein MMC33_000463 [Icmadophila ericetorum]|nr:hypothetical protein [Icmadophila ericetorum]